MVKNVSSQKFLLTKPPVEKISDDIFPLFDTICYLPTSPLGVWYTPSGNPWPRPRLGLQVFIRFFRPLPSHKSVQPQMVKNVSSQKFLLTRPKVFIRFFRSLPSHKSAQTQIIQKTQRHPLWLSLHFFRKMRNYRSLFAFAKSH